MTRKEFILQVVEGVAANARGVFAGHGLNSIVLKTIAERPDVLSKLAIFLQSTKMAKKGPAGLKKNSAMKITGYKTYGDFNKSARVDIESFMGGLSPEDSASFSNEENILTLIILPDTSTGNTQADIVSGKSIMMEFGKAVKKEYKILGGIYLTVMFGNSIIAPVEEKKAEVKAKVNKKISAKKTPAKIKSILQQKAKRKLTVISTAKAKLDAQVRKTNMQLQQLNQFGGSLGAQEGMNVIDAMKNYDKNTKALLRTINPADRKLFDVATKMVAKGNIAGAKPILAELNNPEITKFVLGGGAKKSSDALDQRKTALKMQIKKLSRANEQFLVDMSLSPNPKVKASIKFKMNQNITQINDLRTKLSAISAPITKSGLNNKAKMLADANAKVEAMIMKGASVTQALNAAINALEATPEQKQQIKQQVVQQLADGMPAQYAMQQAVQTTMQDLAIENFDDLESEEFNLIGEDTSLAGSESLQDIMAFL